MEAVKMLAPASLSHIKMCSEFCQLEKVRNIEQFQPGVDFRNVFAIVEEQSSKR